jgi:AcrR family transcriptional regulator
MSEDNLGLKRDLILQTAHQLFVRQGYHGTSMRQIAQQAGVSLGGLYNHFPAGKEQIFETDFLENHPYHEILPALLTAEGNDVESFVRSAAVGLLNSLKDRPDFLNLMFIELVEFNSAHISKLFSALLPKALQIAQRLALVGDQRLRPIPQPILLRSFLGLFFSYHMTELILAPDSPPEFLQGAMEHFIEIYLHGILVGE